VPTPPLPTVPPPLLYADTERSADALYFGRVSVPDPFVALSAHGKKYAVVSALEFGRVKRDSAFDRVLPLEAYLAKARETWPQRKPGAAEVIFLLASELRQLSFTVPEEFPAGVYEKLFELGLDLTVAPGPLFPQREIKTPAEIAALREGNRCSALGIAAAERILRDSTIRGRSLIYQGKPLTSERLKFAIESACLAAGAVSANTIAAGGDQACDPHERGSGPLRPNQLIIVDVFPRVSATGYHGDMTRTFLRGTASDAQRALVAAVRAAQLAALKTIRAGVTGRAVHEAVVNTFTARNYETKHTAKGSSGHRTHAGIGY
jgi:Xaa-Pro aminopeptidase